MLRLVLAGPAHTDDLRRLVRQEPSADKRRGYSLRSGGQFGPRLEAVQAVLQVTDHVIEANAIGRIANFCSRRASAIGMTP